MARYSHQTYRQMFDALLCEELSFNAAYASKLNIEMAIKRVLGRSLKMNCISLYSDLIVEENLDVHFKIVDPDGDVFPIQLIYGK